MAFFRENNNQRVFKANQKNAPDPQEVLKIVEEVKKPKHDRVREIVDKTLESGEKIKQKQEADRKEVKEMVDKYLESVRMQKEENEKKEDTIFKKPPRVNVIEKDEYEDRVQQVFHLLYETLARSFGPYGAPTLIYNYPYSHVTKDGFTIMKNLSMDASDQLVDQAIANMASDICGRLNYSVGDGTTTAVIATNSIYQNYVKRREELTNMHVLPRDILQVFNILKDTIIEKLKSHVKDIQTDNPQELYQNIYDVVYVSSNGDETISDYIASMYAELGFPGVTCELSSDGITRKRLITGFKFSLCLNDKLYINSDDNTMNINNADVIIFSIKITKSIYENILKPLNEQSRARGRKLLVCAASYDETALGQVIRRDLMNEYSKRKDINMVLCTYSAISEYNKTVASDFAMLANTIIIDRELRASIEMQLEAGEDIMTIFNIDNRDDIPNLNVFALDLETNSGHITTKERAREGWVFTSQVENPIRLGYIGSGSIGLKTSLFSGFYYDEARYQATLKDAEFTLHDVTEKYKALGTFNIIVNQAQQRFNALKLKMATIEVGGTSDLSQKLLKDSVDDAIKAAQSAFDNGIILGCNVHMIKSIDELMKDRDKFEGGDQNIVAVLMDILRSGFVDVYKTVLKNAFPDTPIYEGKDPYPTWDVTLTSCFSRVFGVDVKEPVINLFVDTIKKLGYEKVSSMSFYDLLVEVSVENEIVFDLSTKEFTRTVVNSYQTDTEVLVATIDLIALLITGNQMLVTQKHNFE